MRKFGLLFVILLFSSVSMVQAHPDPRNIIVINLDGDIIYEKELLPPKKNPQKHIELFSQEWFYHNFIWILASVIIITVTTLGMGIYKEEIFKKIIKLDN